MADIKDDFNFKRLTKLLDQLPPERHQKFIQEMELKAQMELRDREAYSPREFSVLTGVPEVTIRRWLRGGELKGTKIGRKWLIPHSEIERIRKGMPPPKNLGQGGAF